MESAPILHTPNAVMAPAVYYVCSRPMLYAGIQFQAGDEFPYREVPISGRRLKLLHESRKLMLGSPTRWWWQNPANPDPQQPTLEAVDELATGSESDAPAPPSTDNDTDDDQERSARKPRLDPRIKHVGGGWYSVDVGFGNVERAHGRDAAVQLLEEADQHRTNLGFPPSAEADREPPHEDPKE